MNEQQPALALSSAPSKLGTFVRNHPMLTTAALGGIALFGGGELAAGVLLGAGVDAILRRRRAAANAPESPEAPEAHPMRERAKTFFDRVPHVLRERARAVMAAARGRQAAAPAPAPAQAQAQSPEQPAPSPPRETAPEQSYPATD